MIWVQSSRLFHPIIFHLLLLFLLLTIPQHVTVAQSPIQPVRPLSSHNRSSWGWDPSMAIIIGALAGSFLFVALLSSLLRRCALSYFAQQGNTEWPCSCSKGGIDSEILETFPMLVYSTIKDLRIRKIGASEGSLECAVCITEFTDDDTLRLLPHCNHVFHPPCIDAWLSSHITCPVCRADLTQDPGQVVVWLATTELGGEEKSENDAGEGSGNRAAEQSGEFSGGGSEIGGSPVESEGKRNREEDKGVQKRASKSKLPAKGRVLQRSNTTGHSLVEAGECVERFTLRLPEDVRKYIILNHGVLLKRCASFNVVGNSRRGMCWSDSEGGSSRGKKNMNMNMNMVGVNGKGSVRGKGRMN